MRRPLILLVPILAILALGVWSGSASATCPLSGGPACCDPPTPSQTACCQPTCCGVCTVGHLTIASSPDPSKTAEEVKVTGKLTGGSAGETVTLWQKLAGQSSYSQVAQTTTDSAGNYTIERAAGTVKVNTSWYASTSTAISPTLVQNVSARIKIAKWDTAGTQVKLHGHVSPTHGGERIALQQRANKHWRTIAKARISQRSNFTLRHRFAHQGTVVLRVLFAGDARNTRSTSAQRKLHLS